MDHQSQVTRFTFKLITLTLTFKSKLTVMGNQILLSLLALSCYISLSTLLITPYNIRIKSINVKVVATNVFWTTICQSWNNYVSLLITRSN